MTFPRAVLIAFAALPFVPIIANAQDGWLNFRADARRSGTASKLPAWEKRVAWQRPLLNDKLDGFDSQDNDGAAKDLIASLREKADSTILPGSFPVVVHGLCIYRTPRDVRTAGLQEISIWDEEAGTSYKVPQGHIQWKSIPDMVSLSVLLEKNVSRLGLIKAAESLQANKQGQFLWANATIGAISADDRRVYVIHDIPLPLSMGNGKELNAIRRLLKGNALLAYNANHGKLIWDFGWYNNIAMDPSFEDSFFLGAPLPLDKKLYLLNEKAAELRLMIVDPTKLNKLASVAATLEKTRTLLKVAESERAENNPLRRTQPLHIAHADGLLVCPTHAGVLFGVDREKLAVRWQYRYRAQNVVAPTLPLWQAACPIIHKDRIVFTAADAPDIHCIDLKGVKQWTKPADNDLYLATVTDDIVLLVGKTHCRALALADGAVKWRVEMGLPAGVGVKDGSIYYVPLKRDAVTKGPTIWGIDLAKGKKAGRVEAPYPDALGNLALHRGMFVSQSVTHIAAFPMRPRK